MEDFKPWWASKGVLGPLVSVACLLLAALFGVQIDAGTQAVVVDQLTTAVIAIGVVVGSGIGIWGRIKASRRIGPPNA